MCPCVGVHRRALLLSFSLLLIQYPSCINRCYSMVWKRRNKRLYSPRNYSKEYAASLCSSYVAFSLFRVQKEQPESTTDTATTWKNSRSDLSKRSDFHLVYNLSICYTSAYVDIGFSRRGIPIEVYKLVLYFLRLAILWVYGHILIKTHELNEVNICKYMLKEANKWILS